SYANEIYEFLSVIAGSPFSEVARNRGGSAPHLRGQPECLASGKGGGNCVNFDSQSDANFVDVKILDHAVSSITARPNSRFPTHDSRLTTHESRITTPDFRLTTHDSRLPTHDSRTTPKQRLRIASRAGCSW